MHFTHFAGDVAPHNVSLSAAVLAGLSVCVYRAMKQGLIKPNRGVRNDAAVSSDGPGNVHSVAWRGGACLW